MKSIDTLLTWVAVVSLTACVSACVTSPGPNMESAREEAYDGPKARIAVAVFEDKTSSKGLYNPEFGRGMRDMLSTALFQTNRYIVLEREKLKEVKEEKKHRKTTLEIEDADIVIVAAITGFEPKAGGGDTNAEVLGPLKSLLGGFTGSLNQAYVAMNLRFIDVDTGRIIAATNVEGKATSFSGDVGGIGGKLSGNLNVFAKGPMEAAIRKMIKAAVNEVVQKTPETYYRFE